MFILINYHTGNSHSCEKVYFPCMAELSNRTKKNGDRYMNGVRDTINGNVN